MISINTARHLSNLAYGKAIPSFSTKDDHSNEEVPTEQENNDQIDEITPEQLSLLTTLAHAWVTIISDRPLNKHGLLQAGVDVNKVINITHKQLCASKIRHISKHNQSYIVMLQKNPSTQLPQPFYSQLIQQCEEQNLRLLSLTGQPKQPKQMPLPLQLINFDLQTA